MENSGKNYGCGSCSLSSSLINFQQSLVNCLQEKGENAVVYIWDSKKEVKINSLLMERLREESCDKIQWTKFSCMANFQQPATGVFSISRVNEDSQKLNIYTL